jgi:hypothetical protein
MSEHREPATVASVMYGIEDHGILTFSLYMTMGSCGQGFGNIVLRDEPGDRSGPRLKAELCELFGVENFDDIKGRQCFVLRCFEEEEIEGVEVDGKRWTITGFRKRHYPDHVPTVLENKTKQLRERIDYHARGIQDCNRQLERVADRYRDWELP